MKNRSGVIPILQEPLKWIIRSLMDLDWYKLTMGQFIWKHFPDTIVTISFKNRSTWQRLAEQIDIDELRRQLDQVRRLRFRPSDLEYLRERGFEEGFLEFLSNLQLPEYHLAVDEKTGQLDLSFTGLWKEVTYWETIALAIVNELYFRSQTQGYTEAETAMLFAEGIRNFDHAMKEIMTYPELKWLEFGTRRRFSALWQEMLVRMAHEIMPATQFLGTSNVYLAKKYGIEPRGTMAHELFMVAAALSTDPDEIRASHNKILQQWYEMYGQAGSIALTDTFGSDFFFADMTPEQARAWRGLRQDSGDPEVFAKQAIKWYQSMGINPRDKQLIFSDGLDLQKMVRLFQAFAGKIGVGFGWGTMFTNNLGLDTLSLVVKPTAANGNGTVKISDNETKATGSAELVKLYRQIFGHTGTFSEAQRV